MATPPEVPPRSAPATTPGPAAAAPPEPTDGRTARSQRTREAVVDALLALIRQGNPRPTAREIARQAGISLRSVYVHFDDLEDLFLAAAQRQMVITAPALVEISADGPFDRKVEEFCAQRCRVYSEIAPVRRAAELQEPFSPTLSRLLTFARAAAHDDLARVFAPELDRLDATCRDRSLAVLEAVSSPEAWETLRRTLSPEQAEAAMVETIGRVLTERA